MKSGDRYRPDVVFLLTEGDETRRISVYLLEKLGHVYVGHAQSRTQQGCKLLSGDALILVCVKQLQEGGKDESLDEFRKELQQSRTESIRPERGERKTQPPFTHLRKTSGLFLPKPYLSLEPQKDSRNRCALFKLDLFMDTDAAVLLACCPPASAKDRIGR